jgi:hypothetical protein
LSRVLIMQDTRRHCSRYLRSFFGDQLNTFAFVKFRSIIEAQAA